MRRLRHPAGRGHRHRRRRAPVPHRIPARRSPGPGQYSLPDLANQVFHPFIQGAVREYELLVYDRWGERLFRSTDPMVGWNGTRGARLCPQGVYAWRARGVFYDGSTFDLRGNVTLLR